MYTSKARCSYTVLVFVQLCGVCTAAAGKAGGRGAKHNNLPSPPLLL